MSHHAHGTQRSYGHATRPVPTLPVRTVQERRHALGWGECPADEFFRLLALHNAGKINLLEMPETADATDELLEDEFARLLHSDGEIDLPETAADVADEPAEDDADEQPVAPRRLGVISRTKGSVGIVMIAVSQSPTPMTVREIVKKTGLTDSAVRAVLQRNQQYFVCVGVDGHAKRWQRAGRK